MTKRTFYNSFPSRILKGEINFDGDLFLCLDEVVEAAENVLEKYRGREKDLSQTALRQIIDSNVNGTFIQEMLQDINQALEQGHNPRAAKRMLLLEHIVDEQKLLKESRYTVGLLKQTFGKVQMQYYRGVDDHFTMLMLQSIDIFKKTGEHQMLIQSIGILGYAYQEFGRYEQSVRLYWQHRKAIHAALLSQEVEQRLQTGFRLQLEEVINKLVTNQANDDASKQVVQTFQLFNRLCQTSNQVELWQSLAVIREAEQYLNNNNIREATNILQQYEYPHRIAQLPASKKVIFFKINAERYLKVGNVHKALKNFQSAVQIAYTEGYEQELERLNQIYQFYPSLQARLSQSFSVYFPVW
ncbi:MAG: hypothetical protein ACPGXL_08320 [Chitinophagales bacterium]